ncbi:MAG: FAD-binding oxidoreductase [Alphaproteobacteria bacterium]|nr:FAD-binding oxidoreductase [Alphaproteobacteria bacterium]
MTITDALHQPAAPSRIHRKASTTDREAAEFVPYPERKAGALARALSRAIAGEVRFSAGDRALYATDGSNYRQVPIGVVVPKSVEDVIATMALCRDYGAPFLSRGGGTSLAGQCCNTAVVVDYSKYLNHILSLDPESRTAWVEPGCVLDDLRDAAEKFHLTFGPDPSTHDHNTLGGMIGNNSCGVHSVMAGRTADNVRELDILTFDGLRLRVGPTSEDELRSIVAAGGRRGEIYRRLDELRRRYGDLVRARYPNIPRRVSGYNLDELLPEKGFNVARALVGSEGTCVTVLKAGLRLVHSPPVRALVVIGFTDIFAAGDAVPLVRSYWPLGLEGMDQRLIDHMRAKHAHEAAIGSLPEGCGWLIAEFGGDTEDEAVTRAQGMIDGLKREGHAVSCKLVRDAKVQKRIWEVRKAGLGATAFVPGHPDTWEGWEDSAVPPDRAGDYLRDLDALAKRYGYESALYGHFGDGCIHCRWNFGLRTEEGVAKWRRFLGEAADLVVRFGGSISGEHGDGQSKAELLVKMYGPELIEAFREFKAIWDPESKMNPGKVVDPYPITSNLRLGPDYRPPRLDTRFSFPLEGDWQRAAIRCVGVGECRRHKTDNGVMCPSYIATREEKHSTRGRAHLLFEMMHGGPIEDRWKSDAVEDALDLCLACKGCKHDCPVNVDMATYKAEFRSHHYAGRLRPRVAYSMGLIYWWSRAAAYVPSLANFLTQTPGISALVKWAGGVSQQRRMPPYPSETFRAWFARHTSPNPHGPEVLLFPDTFNNFFRPETAIAAVRVLEAGGWHVVIPPKTLCCARPLYDWGMLDRADALLRELLDTLEPALAEGIPIVGLEPACLAAFRDEVPALFPDDERASRLKEKSFLLSEFLAEHAIDADTARTGTRKALIQVHCHDHALAKPEAEKKALQQVGIEAEIMPNGCCGMAGSFGFEAEKYPWSVKIAEHALLPRLRAAQPDSAIVASGFSCREQIEQLTGRKTQHLAEIMADALGVLPPPLPPARNFGRQLAIAGGIVAGGFVLAALTSRAAARSRHSTSRPALPDPQPRSARQHQPSV